MCAAPGSWSFSERSLPKTTTVVQCASEVPLSSASAWGSTSATAAMHSTVPFGEPGVFTHECDADRAGDRARQPAERVDQPHRLGQAGRLTIEHGAVPSGVRSRGPKPVPPVVTTNPPNPVQIAGAPRRPLSSPSADDPPLDDVETGPAKRVGQRRAGAVLTGAGDARRRRR